MTEAEQEGLRLLDEHYRSFHAVKDTAESLGHQVPSDTKAWSQVLVSTLTSIHGRKRKKGSDLKDGSDVKAANCWNAIDTPRFNGVIPAGRISATSKKPLDVSALDNIPYLFFVLWDEMPPSRTPRCRIWCVRPRGDQVFREMCSKWYEQHRRETIKSNNFQLHPPRNENSNVFRNTCGNLEYPLLFTALHDGSHFTITQHDPEVLKNGACKRSS